MVEGVGWLRTCGGFSNSESFRGSFVVLDPPVQITATPSDSRSLALQALENPKTILNGSSMPEAPLQSQETQMGVSENRGS